MKIKFFGLFATLSLLLTASCSDDIFEPGNSDVPSTNPSLDAEEVEVTFTIMPSLATGISRASSENETTIARGKYIDMLVYAVYGDDGTLLTQYGKGIIEGKEAADDEATAEEIALRTFDKDAPGLNGDHNGQTIINVNGVFDNNGIQTITLRLMRDQYYNIAFWAQSSKTDAYDTNDLTDVKVSYKDALNNDELRDAFCKVESFSVRPGNELRTVILTRPLAQINVGTEIENWNTALDATDVNDNNQNFKFLYSSITLQGLATGFNVLSNNVTTKTEDLATAQFAMNRIPAYMNMEIPSSIEDLKKENDAEEFLVIKDGTEKYKYLSMCYVLVPDHAVVIPDYDQENGQGEVNTYSTTISASFFLAKEQNAAESNWENIFENMNNIPVQRNWRTNIFGSLISVPNPTIKLTVKIDTDYIDEQNVDDINSQDSQQ